MRKWTALIIAVLLMIPLMPLNSVSAVGNDKPLTQLIKEAEAKKVALAKQKQALRTEWSKNQQLLADLGGFLRTAQKNTELGIVVTGSRLFRNAVAPLIKNHGATIVNQLVGINMSSNQSVAQATVQWRHLRDRTASMIANIQQKQKQILAQMQQIDKQISQLNTQIAKWKAAYKKATGYDFTAKLPITNKPKSDTTTTAQKEYDYQAALAAWAADFAGEVNNRKYDDGVCKTAMEFEWVVPPFIKDGKVMGASRIWENDNYYAGPKAGTTNRWVANESYDAGNPGVYISVGDLQRKYP